MKKKNHINNYYCGKEKTKQNKTNKKKKRIKNKSFSIYFGGRLIVSVNFPFHIRAIFPSSRASLREDSPSIFVVSTLTNCNSEGSTPILVEERKGREGRGKKNRKC